MTDMPSFTTTNGPLPENSGWSLYGGRLFAQVPARVTATAADDDIEPIEHHVELEIDVVEGRLACTELRAARTEGGPPITSDHLRRIPVGSWVELAAEKLNVVQAIEPTPDGESFRAIDFAWPSTEFVDDGPTEEALESISQIFAFCMATGQKPIAVLAREYGLTKQTASRWIATAKRRGILVEEHRKVDGDAAG
ncbi:hypothetical protein [Rhodococcus artemisiae]|nr:hypothetical protein [Rhodococcus artemisiae]